MDSLIHADIFFFISTIGFSILCAIAIVGFVYVVGILRHIRRISANLEGDMKNISGEATEFIKDIRKSVVYRMIFGKSRR